MEVGWFTAIIVGGLAGWLAGKLMNMRFGVFMNIILGILGSVVANAILHRFGVVVSEDWLGYLITGFIGAALLMFVAKLVRK